MFAALGSMGIIAHLLLCLCLEFAAQPHTLKSPVLSYVLNVQRPERTLLSQCCEMHAGLIHASCKRAGLESESSDLVRCRLESTFDHYHKPKGYSTPRPRYIHVCWNKHAMMLPG